MGQMKQTLNPSYLGPFTRELMCLAHGQRSLNLLEDIFPTSSKETGPADLGEGQWVTPNRCSVVRQSE